MGHPSACGLADCTVPLFQHAQEVMNIAILLVAGGCTGVWRIMQAACNSENRKHQRRMLSAFER